MQQWTRDDILAFLRKQRSVLKEMGIQRIGLFGSYARNEQTRTSDIDFLISIEPFNFANWMDAWNFLEDHFERDIDLVPEKDLRDELRPIISKDIIYVQIR